ncbi:creatininase family protein [bacterium]|nr:creatininase family protein [bacterium]
MNPRTYKLEHLLTNEVKELIQSGWTRIILPCGATEAHGSIGLGTDTIIPVGIAEKIAPKLHALIAPTIPVGVLRSLQRYPGSIGLKPDIYNSLILNVGEELFKSGFRELIMINGHAGNTGVLKDAAYTLHAMHDMRALVYDWYFEPDDLTLELYGGPGGHSGAGETGMVVAIEPDAAPEGLWKKEDAGALNNAVNAYPGPYPIIMMEEEKGYPDFDPDKAQRLFEAVCKKATSSIDEILNRWSVL